MPHFDDMVATNISDDDVLHTLLVNGVQSEWIDYVYTFGMVYIETQFRESNVSIDVYCNIDDNHH